MMHDFSTRGCLEFVSRTTCNYSEPMLFVKSFDIFFSTFQIANKDLVDSLKDELSGDLEYALIALGTIPNVHFNELDIGFIFTLDIFRHLWTGL